MSATLSLRSLLSIIHAYPRPIYQKNTLISAFKTPIINFQCHPFIRTFIATEHFPTFNAPKAISLAKFISLHFYSRELTLLM